jgi:hypothetical protein
VWKKVSAGVRADFNQADGHEGNLDPKNADGWSRSRVLRQQFLEVILLREPFRSVLTRKGVYIEGAWFVEPLDLMLANIS